MTSYASLMSSWVARLVSSLPLSIINTIITIIRRDPDVFGGRLTGRGVPLSWFIGKDIQSGVQKIDQLDQPTTTPTSTYSMASREQDKNSSAQQTLDGW